METTAVDHPSSIPLQVLHVSKERLRILMKKEEGDSFELSYEASRLSQRTIGSPATTAVQLAPEEGKGVYGRLKNESIEYKEQVFRAFL